MSFDKLFYGTKEITIFLRLRCRYSLFKSLQNYAGLWRFFSREYVVARWKPVPWIVSPLWPGLPVYIEPRLRPADTIGNQAINHWDLTCSLLFSDNNVFLAIILRITNEYCFRKSYFLGLILTGESTNRQRSSIFILIFFKESNLVFPRQTPVPGPNSNPEAEFLVPDWWDWWM